MTAFCADGTETNKKGRNLVKNGRKKKGRDEKIERDMMC